MDVGTLLVGDERIGRLLDAVVQEPVGAVLAKDEPGVDGFPEGRVCLLLCCPVNQGQSGDLGAVAQAGQLFRASWVVAEKRLSFPTMRSTELSV